MINLNDVLQIKSSQRKDYPHLKSISQLRRMHLAPADKNKPNAYVKRFSYPSYYVYDINKAIPYVCTEEERERRRKQWERHKLARRQYVCLKCGSYQGELAYNMIQKQQNGLCDSCYKEVNELYSQKIREVINNNELLDAPTADVIILDIETTGLSPSFDELLSVSIIAENGTVLLDEKVLPSKYTIWPEAYLVNQLSLKDLEGSKTIFELLPSIQKILSSAKTVIGYNHDFDLSFFEKMGIDTSHLERIDVMRLFAPYYGDIDEYHDSFRWKSLVFAAQYFGFAFNAHNSSEDVQATLFVYSALKELIESGTYQKTVGKNEELLAARMDSRL